MKQKLLSYILLALMFVSFNAFSVYALPDYYGWTSCEDSDGGEKYSTMGSMTLINATSRVTVSDYCFRPSNGLNMPVDECIGNDCMILELSCWSAGRPSGNSQSTGATTTWGFYQKIPSTGGFVGCRAGIGITEPAATCSDGLQNQDETGIDCGGRCAACQGQATSVATPTCSDGIRNGEETGIDCGGNCPRYCRESPPTDDRGRCISFCDRYSASDPDYFNNCRAICERNTLPITPTQTSSCTDGIKNGAETDIDCGASCNKCESGKRCLAQTDCRSDRCDSSTCREAASRVAVRTEDPIVTAVPVLGEEATAVPAEEEQPIIAQAETEEGERAFLNVGVQEPGFLSRAMNRFRNIFEQEEAVSGRGINLESESLLDLDRGFCSKDSISGEDACDIFSRMRESINSLRRTIFQKINEDIEPRLEDLEEAARRNLECRKYTVDSPQPQQTTCQEFCRTKDRGCLNGLMKYAYSGTGALRGECETTLGRKVCGPDRLISFRMPTHEHIDCQDKYSGTIDSMVCFCCS